jgi:hypothetical protein
VQLDLAISETYLLRIGKKDLDAKGFLPGFEDKTLSDYILQ